MSKKDLKADPLLKDDESQADEKEQPTKAEEQKEPVNSEEKPSEPAKISASQAKLKDTVAETKAILEKKPHVNFIIPKMDNEPENSVETVQINGYRLAIKKGVMVNIPLPVANLLAEKYRINMEAGREKRIDRASDIREALS